MAILKHSDQGSITGAIGPVTVYQSKGQSIVRKRRNIGGKPSTEKQLSRQQRIKLVVDFLRPIKEFTYAGFRDVDRAAGVSIYNVVTSELLRNAITGTYPAQEIDYKNVILSKGALKTAIGASVSAIDGELIFHWIRTAGDFNSTDRVMLMAYCPELKEAAYEISGAKRMVGTAILTLEKSWQGKYVETYISFRSEGKKISANSFYTGNLKI
ncbi:DUF6266 family protein [Pedobacter sp. MC2016-14]|uniref:DUF6266 family protein n=1 Tax=Pedobacter sp. MC2016-14 TaxID=2897327 RepID=UPI001E5FDAC4|nr:DUF6266 family protein [Pedobacter sp. MC2016-14]MCD0486960.1 DUF6266 family protein [Pedobacter sp. MC2016-14]